MGFSLKLFLEELEYMVSHCAPHCDILKYVKEQRIYAKQCGVII